MPCLQGLVWEIVACGQLTVHQVILILSFSYFFFLLENRAKQHWPLSMNNTLKHSMYLTKLIVAHNYEPPVCCTYSILPGNWATPWSPVRHFPIQPIQTQHNLAVPDLQCNQVTNISRNHIKSKFIADTMLLHNHTDLHWSQSLLSPVLDIL